MKKNYFLLFASLLFANMLFASSFDTQVGTFNGVIAYSNGTIGYVSNVYNTATGINTGMKWQCVEYVNRYYYTVYKLDLKSTGIYGNANHYYNNAASSGLNAYSNGGATAPQVGDIICSNGGSYGHVAIIREVGTNYVKVIQQNWSNDANDESKTLTRSGNTIGDFGSGYPVIGWLRNTQTTPSCSFSVSVESGTQTALVEGWKFWQMSNPIFYTINVNTSNLLGLPYNIWLADENGSPLIMSQSGTNTTMSFGFEAKSPYNNGAKYTLTFCGQGLQFSPWTISPKFYMSALPTLLFTSVPTLKVGKEPATLYWTVSGGIPTLTDGGWTNNIRLQWYQKNQPLENLATVPVANHSFTFAVPSTISNGTIPGCQFKISGSNPDGTSIKTDYVYNYTNEFCIENSTGVHEVNAKNIFNIYPSPANDKITIEAGETINEWTLTISNSIGQEIIKQQIKFIKTQIDISKLSSGTYIVKLTDGKKTEVQKIIKK